MVQKDWDCCSAARYAVIEMRHGDVTAESAATREEALRWFVRLNSGDATAADRAAFDRWLVADPAHAGMYAALSGIWFELDNLPDPRIDAERAHPAGIRAAAWPRRRFLVGGGALAATALAALMIGPLPGLIASDYVTGTGELRTIMLDDGSRLELDAQSALTVSYSGTQRRLRLEKGRAAFVVAPDSERPFVVAAANGTVTALGTEFVMRRDADRVTVSVLESAVRVAASGATGSGFGSIDVAAGRRVTYDTGGIGAVGEIAADSDTAWRRGRLVFEDRPLQQVVADLNRYRRGAVFIVDADLMKLRVSGIFDIRNPDGVLRAIEQTLPVRSIELTPFLVLLRRT